jgi:phosphohistidine phosphatase
MKLYIVRHAWAGQHGDPAYADDSLRPLTEKGHKRFRRMAKKLVKRGFAPVQIASSPFLRCRQTAEILVERLGGAAPLTLLDELKPGAQLDALLPWLQQHADADLALAGHAPDVDRLIADLLGAEAPVTQLEKGGVAAIFFEQRPEPASGTLAWLATAELLAV